MSSRAWHERLYRWLFATEASTRSSALIRILLACIAWAAFGRHAFLHLDLSPLGLLRSTAFNVGASMMLFGIFSRLSTLVTASSVVWFVFIMGPRGFDDFLHHNTRTLAVALLLASLLPSGRSYSVDRWLALRRAERRGEAPPEEKGNVWGLRLLALHVSSIYFYGVVSKCNVGFLSGARMEHYAMWFFFGSRYPTWPGFSALMTAGAIATVVFEAALAVGLFHRRARRYLVPPGLLMHGAFYWLLNVSTFSATMWTLYLAFYDPQEVHRVIERLSGHPREARSS